METNPSQRVATLCYDRGTTFSYDSRKPSLAAIDTRSPPTSLTYSISEMERAGRSRSDSPCAACYCTPTYDNGRVCPPVTPTQVSTSFTYDDQPRGAAIFPCTANGAHGVTLTHATIDSTQCLFTSTYDEQSPSERRRLARLRKIALAKARLVPQLAEKLRDPSKGAEDYWRLFAGNEWFQTTLVSKAGNLSYMGISPEEALSDSLVELLAMLRGEVDLSSWLHDRLGYFHASFTEVAMYCGLQAAAKRANRVLQGDMGSELLASVQDTRQDLTQSIIDIEFLRHGLAHLPETTTHIVLAHADGEPFSKISEQVGICVDTARDIRDCAHERLKKVWTSDLESSKRCRFAR